MANKTVTVAKRGRGDFNLYDGTSAGKTFTRTASDGSTTLTLRSIGYTVDALEVYGGGTAYTDATISSAITAIGTTNNVGLVLNPGTWTMSNNLTIPANITLILPPGAILSGTASLTINGPFVAGAYQVFGSNISIGGKPRVGGILPEWFGVVGDNVVDDTTNFQRSLTFAASLGMPLLVSPLTGYKITATLTVSHTDLSTRGLTIKGLGSFRNTTLNYSGTGFCLAITGSGSESANPIARVDISNIRIDGNDNSVSEGGFYFDRCYIVDIRNCASNNWAKSTAHAIEARNIFNFSWDGGNISNGHPSVAGDSVVIIGSKDSGAGDEWNSSNISFRNTLIQYGSQYGVEVEHDGNIIDNVI